MAGRWRRRVFYAAKWYPGTRTILADIAGRGCVFTLFVPGGIVATIRYPTVHGPNRVRRRVVAASAHSIEFSNPTT
jgi:hypothetical protein